MFLVIGIIIVVIAIIAYYVINNRKNKTNEKVVKREQLKKEFADGLAFNALTIFLNLELTLSEMDEPSVSQRKAPSLNL